MMSFFIGVIVFLFVCWVISWPLPKEEPKEEPAKPKCAQALALVEESSDGNIRFVIFHEE